MTFANPAAAWALLALLAVAAIHMLQRRRRRVLASTLFLLERAPRPTAGGRRIERLRHSRSLWLQLLAVALAAFVLALPQRWREDSFARVVVLVDSSVSMRAFGPALRRDLAARLSAQAGEAQRTEWIVLESVAGRRPLYRGEDRAAALAALAAWEPREGTHDLAPAFEAARSTAGQGGVVLFVTDHEEPVPEGFERLAVGHPFDNVGWLAGEAEPGPPARWQAVVRNHGRVAAQRAFWIETASGRSPAQTLALRAGEVRQLTGALPPAASALTLVLEADGFDVDDRLPLVVPEPRVLRVRAEGDGTEAVLDRWSESMGAMARGEPADVVVGVGGVAAASAAASPPAAGPEPASVRWLAPAHAHDKARAGAITTERHPLVEGLAWQGLLAPEAPGFALERGDTVLVWQATRPLVFLRGARHLYLDFPLEGSNALRLPALLVTLHRFLESVRAEIPRAVTVNVECGQHLTVPGDGALHAESDAPDAVPAEAPGGVRAPWRPAFFHVRRGASLMVTGAAHFTDLREADFGEAASSDLHPADRREARRRQRRDDPWLPLWILVLGATLVADWASQERRA